ncbi:hypothetical protein PsYK624_115910 [Phanerochaete sordida]|uniref:Uncharacterized protein n=1 Tax=Phanerochaete sordida TaxID=48140 RepID=A0A9P3GGX7_9APHY|nr:hypothetical protein PsYK624_115910 [Phanerochaete sordida]
MPISTLPILSAVRDVEVIGAQDVRYGASGALPTSVSSSPGANFGLLLFSSATPGTIVRGSAISMAMRYITSSPWISSVRSVELVRPSTSGQKAPRTVSGAFAWNKGKEPTRLKQPSTSSLASVPDWPFARSWMGGFASRAKAFSPLTTRSTVAHFRGSWDDEGWPSGPRGWGRSAGRGSAARWRSQAEGLGVHVCLGNNPAESERHSPVCLRDAVAQCGSAQGGRWWRIPGMSERPAYPRETDMFCPREATSCT